MKKLSPNQFIAIQALKDSPLIADIEINLGYSTTRITITSIVGADFDKVDAAISLALDKYFTKLEYMGTPAKHENPIDGVGQDLYFINCDNETVFWLIMRLERTE